jgi:Carboxypeptidase regulatory-like domain
MSVMLRFQGLLFFALCLVLVPLRIAGQAPAPGSLHGEVTDPSGAVIPGSQIVARSGSESFTTKSGRDGMYTFRSLAPGSYTVIATARGFAALTLDDVTIAPGQALELKLPLTIETSHEEVTVTGQNQGVSVNPDQNASAMVIRGSDLDALSDDPDELQNELQALAGPSAGPNGGEIYIDGFTGGQLPPKSSILEIRVNQNPFSAEFDRIGYGRIEIITKPGTQKLHGSISSFGTDAALNTANPLIPYQPSYYLYGINGNVNGPLTKSSSYFLNFFHMSRQNQSIVDAVNPQNTSENLQEAFPNPSGITNVNARVDFQVGRNTLTVRDNFFRSAVTGSGVGTLSLPSQASNSLNQENTVQLGDTILVNEALVNEIHLQWRRMRNSQSAVALTPTVTVQGAFTDGGNSSGTVEDHQDDFEIQDKSTATAGKHTLRFGTIMRIYRDANYSTSGENGTYMYAALGDYPNAPTLYSVTQITNPLVRATVYDGSLYFQDDWKLSPNFVLGLGLRYEGQNWIGDHNDWAPRIAFAWSPWHTGTGPAKTVVRGGYGWFYNRFTVPNSFNSFAGTPYVIQTLHDNLVNQRSYTTIFNSNSTSAAAVPTYHTIDPHFHAAIDMQSGIGVDRQITKLITGNITYLYTQGVHQYMSNNVTAPEFDLATYTVTGATPPLYNYQFQSGGVYKQNQIIASVSARLKHLTMNTNYTYGTAKSDTQGVNSFPSVSANPGLDYGRATFGVRHQVVWIGSYSAPKAITVAALIAARSGVPYNLTIGSDLTGNNQFNARPTYGTCGAANVVTTQYGCLDTDPAAAGTYERLMPYGAGIGPANSVFLMRASKVIGIGPRLKTASENDNSTIQSSNSVQGRGLSGGGAPIHLDAAAPRKYSLTIAVGANNVFNQVNLAPPNGVLNSRLFNQTQSLAGNGPYGSPVPGNRTVFLQSNFSF